MQNKKVKVHDAKNGIKIIKFLKKNQRFYFKSK